MRADLIPPVLVQKEANKWPQPPAGLVEKLDSETSTTFTLYIPEEVVYTESGGIDLTIHFHGASWFMQQEHARRGARHPLLVGNAREADRAYEADVMKPGVLENLIEQVEGHLNAHSDRSDASIEHLEISGFSAGYAGVRGILRVPEIEPMVKTVLLSDSLYIGDGPDSNPPDDRKPRMGEDGLKPVLDFARKAKDGECTLLMEFSTTPSMRSVGPMDCARAIISELNIPVSEIGLNEIPASRETADYQLNWRADSGNAHFWCYGTDGRPIHLSHVRNNAEMWLALEGKNSLGAIPPVMSVRPISPTGEMAGETVPLDLGTSGTVTLFVPSGYKVPKDGGAEVTLHFHGAAWFVFQEHSRRGNGDPIVAFELGQGSTVYKTPFLESGMFAKVLDVVREQLVELDNPSETTISSVNITSFSAGYGAVREIIKQPENVAVIKRIVLGDSSYASLDDEALKEGKRVVAQEHVEPWANFARLAMTGEKTLLMTTSEITPNTYAGTYEVARAVAASLGLEAQEIDPDKVPAASSENEYPLKDQVDSGSFHWWGYGGEDAMVHMTLARHIAEDWAALDQCGDP